MNLLKYSSIKINVFIAQDFRRLIKGILSSLKMKVEQRVLFISDIDHFPSDETKAKKALITLPPWAWQEAVRQAPDIRSFNFTGLLYEIVRVLNQNNYVVDILDLSIRDFKVQKDYDLLVGHGVGCRHIIEQLKPHAIILQYVSGAFCTSFLKETEDRYTRFYKSRSITKKIPYRRSMDENNEGEIFLTKKAHYLFSCNAPRMVSGFGKYSDKFFFTGLAAYLNKEFVVDAAKKNFKAGSKNFIYVGGTSGNIQKGLDVILEAFMLVPSAHLFIYCELEPEILKYYDNELSQPNIHYIYHYRYKKKKLSKLLGRINYTIHAPINTGVGTAFVGSMGAGLIPIGYIDMLPNEYFLLANSFYPEALADCIKKATEKPEEWYQKASSAAIEEYNREWSVENFALKFGNLIKQLNN